MAKSITTLVVLLMANAAMAADVGWYGPFTITKVSSYWAECGSTTCGQYRIAVYVAEDINDSPAGQIFDSMCAASDASNAFSNLSLIHI